MDKCTLCREGSLEKSKIPLRLKVDGQEYVAQAEVLACNCCSECMVSDETIESFELMVAERVSYGPVSAKRFKFMRKTLGFSKSELGALLHVPSITITRWEHEKRTVNPFAFALLGLLVRDNISGDTHALQYLKRLNVKETGKSDLGTIALNTD